MSLFFFIAWKNAVFNGLNAFACCLAQLGWTIWAVSKENTRW